MVPLLGLVVEWQFFGRLELILEFDGVGQARCRGIHDSLITGLSIVPDRISIRLESASEAVVVQMNDVVEFNVSGICNGSVVCDLFGWKLAEAPSFYLENTMNVLYANRYHKKDIYDLTIKKKLERPDYLIIFLSCSYGGDIAAVCRSVEVNP